jgi:molecular chaperone IbpA
MRNFDLTPLMRATVGFDRLANLLDTATRLDESALGYPPYNIEKTGEDSYRITMAVAGFGEEDLEITVQENSLVIKAGKAKPEDDKTVKYLHRGIATRGFERRFDLADFIKVTGARLDNGMLSIELEREVPEAMKPRTIAIETKGGSKPKVIENAA